MGSGGSLIITAADSSLPAARRLEAFGQIVQRFQDMAYGCAYAVLGDFHLAQDATQEAFLTAYRQLADLRQPRAFPPWLRRIVLSQCSRLTRRQRPRTASLDAAAGVASGQAGPGETLQKREIRDQVLAAIRALPEHQRMGTTLFYINGYSQKDIAEFLEVPLTPVKKRLADSRSKLKQRMIAMVERELHDNAPGEQFSNRIMEELLARPRPLKIEGHPIRKVLESIRDDLPEYEYIEGEEAVA